MKSNLKQLIGGKTTLIALDVCTLNFTPLRKANEFKCSSTRSWAEICWLHSEGPLQDPCGEHQSMAKDAICTEVTRQQFVENFVNDFCEKFVFCLTDLRSNWPIDRIFKNKVYWEIKKRFIKGLHLIIK